MHAIINDVVGDQGVEGGRLRQHPEERVLLLMAELRMIQDAACVIITLLFLLMGHSLHNLDCQVRSLVHMARAGSTGIGCLIDLYCSHGVFWTSSVLLGGAAAAMNAESLSVAGGVDHGGTDGNEKSLIPAEK